MPIAVIKKISFNTKLTPHSIIQQSKAHSILSLKNSNGNLTLIMLSSFNNIKRWGYKNISVNGGNSIYILYSLYEWKAPVSWS